MQARDLVTLPGAPQIRSLPVRRFRGASDYACLPTGPKIRANGDYVERANTLTEISSDLAHLADCTPSRASSGPQRLLAVRGRV